VALSYGEYKGQTVKGFIRYVKARISQYRKDISYKAYVTDCLSAIIHADIRWYDTISGEKTQAEKNHDEAEEIMKILRDSFYRKEEKQ
jgi:hypothetical protein